MNRARDGGIEGQQEVWLGKVQDWADGQAEKVEEEGEEGQLLILGEVEGDSRKADGLFLTKIGARGSEDDVRSPSQLKFARQSRHLASLWF